jgi:hypothetical protein
MDNERHAIDSTEHEKPAEGSKSVVERLVSGCDLCMTASDDAINLPLYVIGSEGIRACLACRIVLTTVAKGLRSASAKAHKGGFLAGKTLRVVSRE